MWLTANLVAPDSLTSIALIGMNTRRIQLGTSIAISYSRHPLTMIQQVMAIEQVAPGRLRLGIGPSHRPTIEKTYGLRFDRPLEHLTEYALILRQAFEGGAVDFTGAWFDVHARFPDVPSVPLYLAALRRRAYEVAGRVADGAISWVTPPAYLHDVALPALASDADMVRSAGRPLLVAQAFGLVSDDATEVKRVGRERLTMYTRFPFYQEMFAEAGYQRAREGIIEEDLVDELVLTGSEDRVAAGIRQFIDRGADELILSLVFAGRNLDSSIERTLRLLGSVEMGGSGHDDRDSTQLARS